MSPFSVFDWSAEWGRPLLSFPTSSFRKTPLNAEYPLMDPFSNGAGPAAQRPRLLSNRAGRAPQGVAAGVELTRLGNGRWGWGRRRTFQHFCLSRALHLPGALLSPGHPCSFSPARKPGGQSGSQCTRILPASHSQTIPKSWRGTLTR